MSGETGIGVALIAAERLRQITQEGWSREHDRAHGADALWSAANAYEFADPSLWPFDSESFKPRSVLRNLVRAGALYLAAAEIGPSGDVAGFAVDCVEDMDRCATHIDELVTDVRAVLRPGVTADA